MLHQGFLNNREILDLISDSKKVNLHQVIDFLKRCKQSGLILQGLG